MKKFILTMSLIASMNTYADEAPRLRTLMATMGGHAQAMLVGILYDNYDVIINAVAWVNNHPQPTGDMAAIKKELGVEVVRFKWYDTLTHNAANAAGKAAENKDMKEVAKQYGKMIQGCTSCHDTFRDRLRLVLHKDEQ